MLWMRHAVPLVWFLLATSTLAVGPTVLAEAAVSQRLVALSAARA
jgi:hypothetical protein